MNDPQHLEAGLAALVDLYLHMARIQGGQDKIFASREKAEAASRFVTAYQKQGMDAGPQPARKSGAVTNFYDEPRPATTVAGSNPDPAPIETPAPVTEAAPPPVVVGDEPVAPNSAPNGAPSTAPPSGETIAALLNEDED